MEFWELTPKEFNYVVEAYIQHQNEDVEKQKVRTEELVSIVYMNAIWVRCKRMPTLKKVLEDMEKARKQVKKQPDKGKKMTSKAVLNTVKALNAALGGTTY